MKKLFCVFALFFFCSIAGYCQGIPSPSIPKLMLDDGTIVGNTNPMPTAIYGASGNAVEINDDGQMHIVSRGKLDTNNCTDVALASSATFIGTGTDVLDYAGVAIFVTADVEGSLKAQYSYNNTDWFDGESYTIVAGAEKFFTPPIQSAYFRVNYTNGGLPQTSFELCTLLKKQPIKWSSHNIDQAITDQDDAQLTKSVITGKRSDGAFDNATLSNSNRLRVVAQQYGYAVAEGDIPNHKTGSTVGERQNITTAPSDIWQGTATTIPIPPDAGDLISVVSTSVQDTATTGTGAWTLFIGYITPAGYQASTTISLTGTTPVDTGILMRYVNTMAVVTANGNAAAVGDITAYKTGTAATVYRKIIAGTNAELGCHRMVPVDKNMYITAWKAGVAGTGKPVAIRLRATFNVYTGVITPRLFHHLDSVYLETSALKMNREFPTKIPPLTIIKATAKASQAGPYVSASFEGWLEDIDD
jgi:hypothetical protein